LKNSEKISAEFQVSRDETSGNPYFLLDAHSGLSSEQLTFRWVKKGKEKAIFRVVMQSESDAFSLPGVPFGGIWISGTIHLDELQGFLGQALQELQNRKCASVRIIQAPKPYEKYSELIGNVLFKLGFTPQTIQSHQFFLGKKKIKNEAKAISEKLRKHVQHGGFTTRKGPVKNFDFLNDIRNWNSARGYSTLFDEKRLIQQVAEFPDRYFLISILSENQALAHALAVKLVPESLYYYLSAIRPTSNISNGGDLLLQGLFQLAVEQKSDFIDLGSSEVASEINASLMFFKSRFSNDISNKVTWTRSFFYE
jgi:hypothetical protein